MFNFKYHNVKEVSLGAIELSIFRLRDLNVTGENCRIIHQIDAIREYKDLNIYEKKLFWVFGLMYIFKHFYI